MQWGRSGHAHMVVGFTTPYMQSVPITTDIVSSNPLPGEVCNIVIKFVCDRLVVSPLLRVLQITPPIKLNVTISLNYGESGAMQHQTDEQTNILVQ